MNNEKTKTGTRLWKRFLFHAILALLDRDARETEEKRSCLYVYVNINIYYIYTFCIYGIKMAIPDSCLSVGRKESIMEDKDLMEKIISQEILYDGRIVHLENWKVELPDGGAAEREIIRHIGAVAVVAEDEEGRIAMVRQCRIALHKVLMEIPAGKLDSKEEDHLEAAKRELREETGFTANKWKLLTDGISTPGFCDEIISLYLAQDLTRGETQPDEDEFLDVSLISYDELEKRIYAGEIQDMKTITALLMAKPFLGKKV